MDFEQIVVKEGPGLCRCCLTEGCYKDLGKEYTWMNETEVYADMLLECFDISITQHNEGPNGPNRLICEVCITRLRDACYFKKQVQDSEKKFIDMMGRGEFRSKNAGATDTVVIFQQQMKTEAASDVPANVVDAEVEFLDEEIGFADDAEDDDTIEDPEPSVSDITVSSLPIKGKRGRPKKTTAKTDKKAKIAKLDDKPKAVKSIGKGDAEAPSKSSMTSTKRNKLMKRNAIIIIENTTVIPFKWHRQNYLCFYCHLTFKDHEMLKTHTVKEHKKSNIKAAVSYLRRDEKVKIDVSTLQCKICNNDYNTLEDLLQHLKTHNKIFTEECGYGIIPYKLNEHFHCAVCKQEFQYFTKLNQHMNEHFGNYICELCGKSFLSQGRLRCHSLTHGSKFRCNVCSETFDSLTQKNNHESKVHKKDKLLKCFYCNETFQNYNQRKRHHSLFHDIKVPEYNCPVCDKTFQIMSKMRVHLKEVHIREKNFSCTMCEQKFFSKTHVQKHMVKHFGERVHQCEVCKKSYARRQTLKDHMRIHSNDRRYICSVCSQGFVQNNSMRLHMKVHHPEVVTA
ncbi:uncharacterized protein LOC142985191 isoform X7 [Anticarsia gemmatalis]|uniref:uncharacterized protein LOC142985191 isoform X7 n=1 Tax=Anticarsia gemmatalis TaxID=129554 RepID=UPI003F763ADF